MYYTTIAITIIITNVNNVTTPASLLSPRQVTRCEAGEFSHALDFHCQACTSGYYSSPGAKECKVCPPGQYTAGPGRGRCDQCPAGFACPGLKAQPKYVFVMKGCKCANEKIMRLASGYNTPDKCYEKCRQTEGCISFFMWDRLTINEEEVNGVCDLAKCSFGARPEQIGEDFPKPSMPYPQHDLKNCPVFFRNDLITASYELAGECVHVSAHVCVCVCVCVCVSHADDLKHIAVGWIAC